MTLAELNKAISDGLAAKKVTTYQLQKAGISTRTYNKFHEGSPHISIGNIHKLATFAGLEIQLKEVVDAVVKGE